MYLFNSIGLMTIRNLYIRRRKIMYIYYFVSYKYINDFEQAIPTYYLLVCFRIEYPRAIKYAKKLKPHLLVFIKYVKYLLSFIQKQPASKTSSSEPFGWLPVIEFVLTRRMLFMSEICIRLTKHNIGTTSITVYKKLK